MTSRVFPGLLAGLAAGLLFSPSARADQVPTCTEQDLVSTLLTTSDGTVTFGEDCTIDFSEAITLTSGTTLTIDSQGYNVSFAGGGNGPLFILRTNVNLKIIGITLSGGVNTNGGALYIDKNCEVLITNCVVTGNSAVGPNGTPGANGRSATYTYANGDNGTSGYPGTNGFGGAIYNLGRLTLINCLLANNSVTGGNGGGGGNGGAAGGGIGFHGGNGGNGGAAGVGLGGAVYSVGPLALSNCMVLGNKAAGGTGGAGGTNGSGNVASLAGSGGAGASGSGAGIYSLSPVTLINCTFATNTATSGASANAGSANTEGPDGNSGANSLGGGVFTAGGAVTNCTFAFNTVAGGAGGSGGAGVGTLQSGGNGGAGGTGSGGGLYSTGVVAVVHCTFASCGATGGAGGTGASPGGTNANSGQTYGGGIANGLGTFVLMNSLLSTNSPGANAHGSITDAGYNLSSDSTPSSFRGMSRLNLDPQIKAMAANGGPTNLDGSAMVTIAPFNQNSPAYGVINTNTTNYVITFDERGAPRPGGGKRGCDIGAYEIGPPFIPNATNPLFYAYPTYGDPVTFQVFPVGDSPLYYYWFYNGTNVPATNGPFYTVPGVTNLNRGVLALGGYQVIVSNIYGTVLSPPEIVHFVPGLYASPTNLIVYAGNPVTNNASATGDPPFNYQWQLNGTNLVGPGALTLGNTSTNASYVISSPTTNDSGPYTLVITNNYGSVTSAVGTLYVDQINSQPASQTVAANSTVTFSVNVVGSSSKTYQWFFNGSPAQGQATPSSTAPYTFSASTTNQGTYYVQISDAPPDSENSISFLSAPATLTVVAAAPSITSQPAPSSLTITQGQNAAFSVAAIGGALSYQWQRNGVSVPGANGNAYAITAAQFADSGTYTVLVTNLLGGVISSNAQLAVVSMSSNATVAVPAYQATSVHVAGTNAYITLTSTNGGPGFLQTATIGGGSLATNPPVAIANPALSVFITGTEALVSCGASGLEVVDVTTPSSPAPVVTNAAVAPALGCFVASGYAYVASGTNGLQVVSLSALTNPPSTNVVTDLKDARSVCVSGNYAYVGDAVNGLNVFNISTPSNPTWVTNCAIGAPVLGVQISGNLAYLAATNAGLQVVSLANPTNPVVIGSANTSRSAYGLAVSGAYVFVADGTNGMLAFDTSNPANIQLVGTSLVGDARGVDVAGDYVYAATADNGVVVLDATPILGGSPQIQVQPQSLSIGEGSNAVFSVTAVGTDPLAYQWTSNTVPLVGATGTSLTTLSNVVAANYAVIISNAFGVITSDVASLTLLPCTYTFDSNSVSLDSDATNDLFYVTNSGACEWEAVASTNWIQILTPSGGGGATPVQYSVTANPSTNSRTGVIFITDFSQTNQFLVVQGGQPIPEYALSVDTANVPYGFSITVSPADDYGNTDPTYGNLYYYSNVLVRLSVPASINASVFQSWQLEDGTPVASTATVEIYMRGDLTLVPVYLSPLTFVKGTYYGLFSDPNASPPDTNSSGSFTLSTTAQRKYSGVLQLGSTRYSISGQFDTNGNASSKVVTNRNHSSIQVDMSFPGTVDQVTGLVSVATVDGEDLSADLLAFRASFSANNVPSQEGQYTMIIPGTDDSSGLGPVGDSYGAMSVSKTGTIQLSGTLADGTKFTQGSYLGPDGEWPLYVPLYSGQGMVLSWITVGDPPGSALTGDLTWLKPALPNTKYYPEGFIIQPSSNAVSVLGSFYARPPSETTVLPFNLGEVVLTGGDLAENMTNFVTLNFNNSVSSTNRTSVSISLQSGLFSGHVINPSSKKPISFQGIVMTNLGAGYGFFLGTNQSGEVLFQQH
jgi:hypothetical protein